MTITERINNPVYNNVNEWLQDQGCITMNVFEMQENEVFYYALQKEFPGISMETTDIFFKLAKRLSK